MYIVFRILLIFITTNDYQWLFDEKKTMKVCKKYL